jgi:hypothetical protein
LYGHVVKAVIFGRYLIEAALILGFVERLLSPEGNREKLMVRRLVGSAPPLTAWAQEANFGASENLET